VCTSLGLLGLLDNFGNMQQTDACVLRVEIEAESEPIAQLDESDPLFANHVCEMTGSRKHACISLCVCYDCLDSVWPL
jgi:hypothetical protein